MPNSAITPSPHNMAERTMRASSRRSSISRPTIRRYPLVSRKTLAKASRRSTPPAAGRRAPVIELDRTDAIPQLGRHRAEISRHAMAFAVGDEIEAVAGRLASLGDDANELIQSAGPVLLGKTFELGVDRLIELPRQQHRRVPVDIGDGEDRRGAEQRKIGQR